MCLLTTNLSIGNRWACFDVQVALNASRINLTRTDTVAPSRTA